MNGRQNHWLSRRRAIALAMLGLIVTGVVVMRAQATTSITLRPRQLAAASLAVPSTQPTTSPAAGEGPALGNVVTDSSKSTIDIGLTYDGEQVELFGALGDGEADAVIVKITSPAEDAKLNQKGRVGPFWMSVKQHTVHNVPFMYHINASDKIDAIVSADVRRKYGIGLEEIRAGMKIELTKGTSEPEDEEIVFAGLRQLKKDQGLYRINDDKRIVIKQGRLFRHTVDFPSAAKEGNYLVETLAFRQGRLVGKATDHIRLRKVGLEAKVVYWAHHSPKAYGVCAVIIALGAGLLVGFVFKKGGHH